MIILFYWTWASAESSVWKVQKDQFVIYLGATVHFLREKDYPLPPEFDQAYKLSEIVVFETDIGKLQEPSVRQKLLAQVMYADGSTVDRHLSPRAYELLSAYCESNSIPLQPFKQFKPSMLMITLTLLESRKLCATQQGVDLFFYKLANRDKKKIQGLETVEEQINFISTMADGHEDDFVIHSINDLKTIKQKFEVLINAWRTGDSEKLNELMVTELKTQQRDLYRKLNTDRNNNWLPLIEAYLKTPQTEFILVGALHLLGPDGIIEALRNKGYTVDKL